MLLEATAMAVPFLAVTWMSVLTELKAGENGRIAQDAEAILDKLEKALSSRNE
jgi:hypothetical protein